MKKLSLMFLACFLAVTLTANAQMISPGDTPSLISAPSINPYSLFGDDYKTAMAWAVENGVLTGDDTTGALRETDCVRRAELLKMLFRVLQISEHNSNAELFADTPADQWYAPFVRKARELNTINGYPDGTFKPGVCVNRAEALKVALLAFPNINPVSIPNAGFGDVPTDQWYYQYVSYALMNNLAGKKHIGFDYNTGDALYYPADPMTREEFAELVYRLKTLRDNNLSEYNANYGPENVNIMPLQDYNLEPEEYFDYDTMMLAVLDTNDQDQVNILNGFLNDSPAGDTQGFLEDLLKELADELDRAGLTYDGDLQPAFGDRFKIYYGMSTGSNYMPNMALVITIDDMDQLEDVFNEMADLSDYKKSRLFGFNTLTNPQQDIFFAYDDEVLVAWPNFASRYLSLQKIKNGEKNLLDNAQYNDLAGELPSDNIGMIYYNAQSLGTEAAAISIEAVSEGLKLDYRINVYNGYTSGEPSMYKKLPGNDLMIYAENYGFKDNIEAQEKAMFEEYGYMDDVYMDMTYSSQFDEFLVTDGDWLNQGVAFMMQDTGYIMPGLSIYFDSNGYESQAQEDINNIDSMITEYIDEMAAADPEFGALFIKDTVNVDGETIHRITYTMPETQDDEFRSIMDMFEIFFGEPLEFYYGITSDDYVVFALYNDFDEVYGEVPSVSNNADIQEGMDYISAYPNVLSYLSVGSFVDYVDNLVFELESASEPLPAETRNSFDEVLDYLDQIKYMINAEKDPVGNMVEGRMFVKID